MIYIILFIILLSIVLFTLYHHNRKLKSSMSPNHIINPPEYYWINRVDGSGKHDYFNDAYLKLSITPFSTSTCSTRSECKELNVDCIDHVCVPYSNAEIYNGTCCDTVDNLKVESYDLLTLYRKSLLKMVCENEVPISNCNLSYTPTITLDDPFTQTKQSIRDTVINSPYLYKNVTQTVQCNNLHNGSRGFGFWNTTTDFKSCAIAWFIQLDGGKDEMNGFYIQCQKPMTGTDIPISFIKIKELDEKEHTYQIEWKKDSIRFYMDNELVHIETKNVPDIHMAYHNWVDNATFTYQNGQLVHIMHPITSEKSNIIKQLEIV